MNSQNSEPTEKKTLNSTEKKVVLATTEKKARKSLEGMKRVQIYANRQQYVNEFLALVNDVTDKSCSKADLGENQEGVPDLEIIDKQSRAIKQMFKYITQSFYDVEKAQKSSEASHDELEIQKELENLKAQNQALLLSIQSTLDSIRSQNKELDLTMTSVAQSLLPQILPSLPSAPVLNPPPNHPLQREIGLMEGYLQNLSLGIYQMYDVWMEAKEKVYTQGRVLQGLQDSRNSQISNVN